MEIQSILTSTKKYLGGAAAIEENTAFDQDIMMFINSAFAALHQVGVGPKEGYSITDKSNVWSEFLVDQTMSNVKTYVWTSVKISFDPPSYAHAVESLRKVKDEAEFRLMFRAEEKTRG